MYYDNMTLYTIGESYYNRTCFFILIILILDLHCDVNGCGTVLIFDADQKLTRKKCSSKVGCKIMTVGDSNFKFEAKTGCIESPMQTSK